MTSVVKANGQELVDQQMGVKAPINPIDEIRRLYAANPTQTTAALVEALTGLVGRNLLSQEEKMILLKALVNSL